MSLWKRVKQFFCWHSFSLVVEAVFGPKQGESCPTHGDNMWGMRVFHCHICGFDYVEVKKGSKEELLDE